MFQRSKHREELPVKISIEEGDSMYNHLGTAGDVQFESKSVRTEIEQHGLNIEFGQ